MKMAYAFRKSSYYPWIGLGFASMPGERARSSWLDHVQEIGFDAIELGMPDLESLDGASTAAKDLRAELDRRGLGRVVRVGAGFTNPRTEDHNRAALMRAVELSGSIGCEILNIVVASALRHPNAPGASTGEPVSQGSSRDASHDDFERTARHLRDIAAEAVKHGMKCTIEMHHLTIADNSWSTLHLLDLIDSPVVLANPDLGNIVWSYDTPEETTEDAIVALAPRSGYWHCKNLKRVPIAAGERTAFIRVPLPDGEIDYRFSVAAMLDAGYSGYMAVEGALAGDQLHADKRSFDYARSLIDSLST